MSKVRVDREQGATFVELFFDLVFVYAITQLTSTVLHDLTWSGVGKAALLFWLVWWAWTQFTWTLNEADTEHVWVRLPVLAATAVAFFLAQAVPDALTSAGLWFAVSYVAVRLIGLGLQVWVFREDEQQRTGLSRWAAASQVGLLLVLVGGFVHGDVRIWLWFAALVADILAATVAGRGTWDLVAGHFAERHGLIVIIALGESLIAAGVATADLPRDGLFMATVAGAVVATCALWWSYFGTFHEQLEDAMGGQGLQTRGQFARDVFSLWHAVIVAGVIGIAVGFEEAIAHPDEPLHLNAAMALTFGVALFVGGAAGAGRRAGFRVGAPRLGLVVAALAATWLLPSIAPAVVLWTLAGLMVALSIIEMNGRSSALMATDHPRERTESQT